MSGEAILSAENSGKPLGGRGAAPNPAGRTHSAPRPPIAGGELAALPKTPPRADGLRPRFSILRPNEKFWARPYPKFSERTSFGDADVSFFLNQMTFPSADQQCQGIDEISFSVIR